MAAGTTATESARVPRQAAGVVGATVTDTGSATAEAAAGIGIGAREEAAVAFR